MRKTTTLGLLLMLIVGGGAGFGLSQWQQKQTADTASSAKPERKILYYRNAMGLKDTSPVPKKDSMGMDYIPVYADDISAQPAEKKVLFYRNPMGLKDTSPVPKKDSMGMDYIPVYADGDSSAQDSSAVKINSDRLQTLGVQTSKVNMEPVFRAVRAVGQFAVDEKRQYNVTTKFDGWIEKLAVNTTGQNVKAGQLLMEVYSPELLAAQQEYLIARENQNALKALPGKASFSLSQAALERMKIWDIPASELNRLTKTGEVRRRLALLAPTSGVVLSKTAVQGMKFTAGETLFEIADLSQIWLLVDVFEQDLGLVKSGQKVNVKVNAYPDDVFNGTVAFIYPTLNSETRTVKVRIELDNKDGRLKPSMYGEANLQVALTAQPQVTVPESALIDSGTRQVVLVQTGNGKFAPRQVKTGGHGETTSGERKVVIKEGLADGESVVTRANFLIDSESNLQAAFSGLGTEATSAPASTETMEAIPASKTTPTTSTSAMADMPGMVMTNEQNGGK